MVILLALSAIGGDFGEVLPVPLETPPFEYSLVRPAAEGSETWIPDLVLLSETTNDVIDYEEWFDQFEDWPSLTFHNGGINDEIRGTTPPGGIPRILHTPGEGRFYLSQVIRGPENTMALYGDHPNRFGVVLHPRILAVVDPGGQELPLVLDFLTYAHGPDDLASEAGFTFQSIYWADEVDGVLYVSNAHGTFAESSGGLNAFVTALDTGTLELLWRSEPLVANSENFVVIGGAIVAGYGFSDEEDFICVLDRHTGVVVDRIPVPSAPNYLRVEGDRLYVRCYDTDLVYSIR